MQKALTFFVIFAIFVAVIGLLIFGDLAILRAVFLSILIAATTVVVVGALVSLADFVTGRIEIWKQRRATTRRIQRDAQFTVVTAKANEQVYLHDSDPSAQWRAAHHDPRIYADGMRSTPDQDEWGSFILWLDAQRRSRPSAPNGATNGHPMLASPHPMDLLSICAAVERLLVVGGAGSGKTTVLQHLIGARSGQVVVIDPHDDGRTWPAHAQVIGAGQDYDSIERGLFAMKEQVRQRYQRRAGGTLEADDLTVVIDEWFELTQNIDSAGDSMRRILTGGRKVNVATFVGSHSDRAKPLGLEGAADLKNGFAIIRLKGGQQFGYYAATLDMGDGEIPVTLPGPYRAQLSEARPLVFDVSQVELPLSDQEQDILALWDGGEHSVSRIGAQVYGQRGGWQNERVIEVLEKHKRL